MKTDAVVVGAGHAGLAMSRCLAERAIEHVVLERGEVANSWRSERWDSLTLLTPNWQSRLPGYGYAGADPDGYRTMPQTVAFIERYAKAIDAPVRRHTTVTSVRRTDDGYVVGTDHAEWHAPIVVLASGACNFANVPAFAESVPSEITQLTPMRYRNPSELEPGGVLVVGASASGVQIAEEIQRSGRPVTLAVGEHIRVPRVYRGRDIQWWMDAAGVLDQRYDEVDDINRARNVPSLQLAGYPDRRSLDLNSLAALGVKLVGRLAAIRDGKAVFAGSLANKAALSDLKMNRLLEALDAWAAQDGLDILEPPHRFEPTRVDASPRLSLDLARERIRTVLWATGYRPDHSWLQVPVLDPKGRIRHDGGVVADSPGLYLMGLQFMRRRKSALIDGAGNDARDLAAHIARFLREARRRAAPRRQEARAD
ncbi:MAG TPA: NAD(P)-binding domain-containing protein [Burkholderiales bacterium]|nr:NAD(P)-binding domain-containing protein [Burkholderiales bacterium]